MLSSVTVSSQVRAAGQGSNTSGTKKKRPSVVAMKNSGKTLISGTTQLNEVSLD